jgi:hypothetical protein
MYVYMYVQYRAFSPPSSSSSSSSLSITHDADADDRSMEDRLRVEDIVFFRVLGDAEVAKEEATALANLRQVIRGVIVDEKAIFVHLVFTISDRQMNR